MQSLFYLRIQNKLIFPLSIRSRLNIRELIIIISSTFYIVHHELKLGNAEKYSDGIYAIKKDIPYMPLEMKKKLEDENIT